MIQPPHCTLSHKRQHLCKVSIVIIHKMLTTSTKCNTSPGKLDQTEWIKIIQLLPNRYQRRYAVCEQYQSTSLYSTLLRWYRKTISFSLCLLVYLIELLLFFLLLQPCNIIFKKCSLYVIYIWPEWNKDICIVLFQVLIYKLPFFCPELLITSSYVIALEQWFYLTADIKSYKVI